MDARAAAFVPPFLEARPSLAGTWDREGRDGAASVSRPQVCPSLKCVRPARRPGKAPAALADLGRQGESASRGRPAPPSPARGARPAEKPGAAPRPPLAPAAPTPMRFSRCFPLIPAPPPGPAARSALRHGARHRHFASSPASRSPGAAGTVKATAHPWLYGGDRAHAAGADLLQEPSLSWTSFV